MDFSQFKPEIKRRFDLIQKRCRRYKDMGIVQQTIPAKILPRNLVNDKYRVLFCLIPKVSATTWRRMFLSMSGKVPKRRIFNLTNSEIFHQMYYLYDTLQNYDQEGVKFRLKNYTKVIFVRDPLERLLSAYRSKFVNTRQFDQIYGARIISNFRQNYTKIQNTNSSTVTFLEFVKFVTEKERTWFQEKNLHWSPYWDVCYPCTVNYDYIGKFENLVDEANDILRYIGATKIQFPNRDLFYYASKTKNVMNMHYSKIPQKYLENISKMFERDFKLFSYKFP